MISQPTGRTILLFTRAPEAEARAKRLPLAEGSNLFAGFLKGWRQRALDAGAELVVATPASSEKSLGRLLPGAVITVQANGSFSERVEHAFSAAFQRGARTVLMVGGDGPPLEPVDIGDAFSHLESRSRAIVLAPAEDGGVNAIGFTADAERPLHSIAWRSSDVCRQLQSEAARHRLVLLLTTPGHDLDCAANVAGLYRLSRENSEWTVFRWLLHCLLTVCRSISQPAAMGVAQAAPDAHSTRGPPLYLPA